MKTRKIRIYPDPILKVYTKEVEKIDSNIKKIVNKMFKIIKEEDGVGLAANQIGYNLRILIAQLPDGKPYTLINPEIKEMEGEDVMDEGCLSFPGISIYINRASKIKIIGLELSGNLVEYVAEGLLARVFQHEVDHLNGKTIIDYLTKEEFIKFQRCYDKILKEGLEKKGGL